ncbi:MAG: hypothetical protein KC414_12590, partial [Romboutsia sp.]|nr:hypothetical protein [Romboutsia sp.]
MKYLTTFVVLVILSCFYISTNISAQTINTFYIPLIYKQSELIVTPSPTFTPEPISTPLPHDAIVTSVSVNTQSSAYNKFYGLVENYSNKDLGFLPKVTINLYNEQNQLIHIDYSFIKRNHLPIGEKSCFVILVDKDVTWSYYTFEVDKDSTSINDVELPIQDMNYLFNDSNEYIILGNVYNNQNNVTNYVKVIGTLFDGDNNVIGCEDTYTSNNQINPNEKTSFKLI